MSAEKKEIEIVSVIDVPSLDPKRAGKFDTIITYRVDPMHTFSLRVAKDELTDAKIEQFVKADYEKKKTWIGKKITV
ncbi:MAG: hypothetical protein QXW26_04725 [Candidatus Nitrosocaldus sp.]